MRFNERLKQLRLTSALMQKEIAEMVGVSVRTFQWWEYGKTEPNIEKLIKLADIFQVSIDYLVCHETSISHATDVEDS